MWILIAGLLVCTEFVDELPELEEIYSVNPIPKPRVVLASDAPVTTPRSLAPESPSCSTAVFSTNSDDLTPPSSLYSGAQVLTSRAKRRRTNESERSSFHFNSRTSPAQEAETLSYHEATQSHDEPSALQEDDGINSLLKAAGFSEEGTNQAASLLSPASQDAVQYFATPTQEAQPDTPGIWPQASVQEACLMRYFIDELACWVCFTPGTPTAIPCSKRMEPN